MRRLLLVQELEELKEWARMVSSLDPRYRRMLLDKAKFAAELMREVDEAPYSEEEGVRSVDYPVIDLRVQLKLLQPVEAFKKQQSDLG